MDDPQIIVILIKIMTKILINLHLNPGLGLEFDNKDVFSYMA